MRRPYDLLAVVAIAIAITAGAAPASAEDIRWEFTAQVRPRFEIRDGYQRLHTKNEGPVSFFSQRTRLGVRCIASPQASAFVQLQDVRTWGEERGTSSDAAADAFEAHQAYVDLRPLSCFMIRVGRQELSYDEERILGNSDWLQQGRAHDAVCLQWDHDVWAAHSAWAHNESGELLSSRSYRPFGENYKDLVTMWVARQWTHGKGSLIFVYDRERPLLLAYTNRCTFGSRIERAIHAFEFRLETYWQLGHLKTNSWYPTRSWNGTDTIWVSAFMVASRVSYDLGAATLALWYDYLSGNHSSWGTYRAFSTPYPSNHGFYGWADYFLNIPQDNKQRGLQDLALKGKLKNLGPASGECHIHYFWYAQPDERGDKALGLEIDLGASYPVTKGVTLQAGYAHVEPTDALKRLKGGETAANWFYSTLDFNVK